MKINYPSLIQYQQFLELKDYRPPTKEEYLRQVRKLAQQFECDPATLTQDQVREYFLFLRQEKKVHYSSMNQTKWALRSFYCEALKLTGWSVFDEVRIHKLQTLPKVLSRAEVQKVLQAVREPRFSTCLRLMYHCGLRISEAVALQVRDIRGHDTPPRLYIRDAKGGKDRCVPIAPPMVEELRQWWRTHRHPKWLFPGPGHAWADRRAQPTNLRLSSQPMRPVSVQNAFQLARLASGISVAATPHTLRQNAECRKMPSCALSPSLSWSKTMVS